MKTQNIITKDQLESSEKAVSGSEMFHLYAKRTAESVLNMAKVVLDMKSELKGWEFAQFCDLIGYDPKSSAIRKFVAIAVKYSYLIARADKLPSSWTTIYQISRLSEDEIGQKIDKGLINSKLMGANVQRLLGMSKPSSSGSSSITGSGVAASKVPNGTVDPLGFRVRLCDFPSAESVRMLNTIFSMLNALNVEVEVSTSLEEFLVDAVAVADADANADVVLAG